MAVRIKNVNIYATNNLIFKILFFFSEYKIFIDFTIDNIRIFQG